MVWTMDCESLASHRPVNDQHMSVRSSTPVTRETAAPAISKARPPARGVRSRIDFDRTGSSRSACVLSVHVAGRDRVDVDATSGPFVGKRFRQLREAALAAAYAGTVMPP
jgi:hypothetical protein